MLITVLQKVLTNWHNTATDVELRIVASTAFISSDGSPIQPAPFYQSVTCTPDLTAKTLTIPQFTIWSTADALDLPNIPQYTFTFYCGPFSAEPVVNFVFGNRISVGIPIDPTTTTLDQIEVANSATPTVQYDINSVINQSISAWYSGVPFPDGDTRPSIAGHQAFYTRNTSATDILDFENPYNQKVIWVFIGDDNTSIFGDPRNLGAFLQFGYGVDNQWHEMTSGALGIQTINGNANLNQIIETNGAVDGSPTVSSVGGTTTLTNPIADATHAGIVTADEQTLGGDKLFEGEVTCSAEGFGSAFSVGGDPIHPVFQVINPPSGVNGIRISGQATGTSPTISAIGDANLDLELESNGTGAVKITTGVSLNKRFVFDANGFSTPEPIILQGATSGQTKLEAQAIAGDYILKTPNTTPTIGQNVGVGDVTGNVITLAYQPNGSLTDADPVGIPGMFIGVSTPSQIIMIYTGNTTFLLPLAGSTAIAKVAATAQTDFDIQVNGVSKGTIRFAASGTVASIVSPVSSVIGSNDVIEIIGPVVPDLTLANVGFNLKGTSNVAASTPVSLATTLIGLTTPTQEIYTVPANSSFTLPGTGSTAVAKIAATAQTDFLVKVNTVTKFTLRFAASATVATVFGAVSASIVSGNLIEIIGPATPDLTLANIGFNLLGST